MLALQINNPVIENYFHDTTTIQKVLEYIATNKISIEPETKDLTNRLIISLQEIQLLVEGKRKEKLARDFLNEL